MIILFKWRQSFPGFLPIKLDICIYHLVNVAFHRDLRLPIIIPRERLTKMKINTGGSGILCLNFVSSCSLSIFGFWCSAGQFWKAKSML
jgi:hypothetical protein